MAPEQTKRHSVVAGFWRLTKGNIPRRLRALPSLPLPSGVLSLRDCRSLQVFARESMRCSEDCRTPRGLFGSSGSMIDHSLSVSSYRRRIIQPPSQWRAWITLRRKPQADLWVYRLIAVALQSSAISLPCDNLMREFIRSEYTYGVLADAYEMTTAAGLRYGQATKDWSDYSREAKKQAALREEYEQKADRMVALLSGNHCPMPDHTISPETYRAERKTCIAQRQANPASSCNYEQPALEKWIAASRPAPSRRRK